jgi:hypothetical protein
VIVTDCDAVYVPATGVKVGAAVVGAAIVYAAEATALAVWPLATAIASNVSLALMLIGPVYTVEAVVGVAPLVV